MLRRFWLYGCVGWVLEVGFTGLSSVLHRDRSATARTYLWMHPIYGTSGLALELLSKRLRFLPRPLRAAAFLPIIYATEYATGWLLCRLLGRCPWDYGSRGVNLRGLIRLDYAPYWYLAALIFEPVAERVRWNALAPRHDWSLEPLWR